MRQSLRADTRRELGKTPTIVKELVEEKAQQIEP